ncbi:MAG: hypothetical protein ACMUJM_17335 [bacterium]
MKFSSFNRNLLDIKPLSRREHDLTINIIKEVAYVDPAHINKKYLCVAEEIQQAKKKGSSVIVMMGAHVIRSGVQKYLIDLMKNGFITCIATNGAGIIHDFELSMIGATTESVRRYIKEGQFGLWKETGILNDIINEAYKNDPASGLGEVIGRAILTSDFPYKEISIFGAAYDLNIPITVHVGIGYDIIHGHPNCDGAATGALSYNDFLLFASVIQNLEGGVIMNFGSAVMAPEVYLKALSMARNVSHQENKEIRKFTTLVCDLHELPDTFKEEPSKESVFYYFRPWKTMLARTVAEGGKSYYIKARHSESIPALWSSLNKQNEDT